MTLDEQGFYLFISNCRKAKVDGRPGAQMTQLAAK
jgi:hypothetical protein